MKTVVGIVAGAVAMGIVLDAARAETGKGAAAAGASNAIETWLDDRGAFWRLSADAFLTRDRAPSFRWLAADTHDEAHYPAYPHSPPLNFLGTNVVEANLRFAHGIAASLHLWPYSRGDAGALSEGQFKALLADWNRRICAWAGGMGSEPRRTRVAGNDLMRKGWVKGPYAITLGWSSSGHSRRDFRAEYVQIEVAPFGPGHGPVRLPGATVAESPAAKVAGRIAARKVVRRQDGDVCLEGLPMVDQGRKGYCAAAAAERILRFYGMDVSQHVIAQLADSDRSRGTNPQLMLGELRRAGQKFGVKVREHYSGVDTFAKLEDLMNNYNLAARENRAERVTLPNVGVTDLAQVYASLAPAPFRQARCENQRVEYRKFLADLRDRIGKGIPLLWSVYLGTFAETPALPPGEGFHMRVIIGYNDRTQTVIYSDSWGAGHEFKKMPFDRAWTITTGLYSFDPRR